MENNSSGMTAAIVAVALIIGVAGGYLYGQSVGVKKGLAQAEVVAKQKAEDAVKAAEKLAAQAANPFAGTSNPLESVTTNPFAKVKTNPFAQ